MAIDSTTTTILSAILSGVISFFIGWKFHKSKLDADAIQVHFKELKDQVILPLLRIAERDPDSLQSKDQLPITSGTIDNELFKDLWSNHYPQLATIIDKLADINKDLRQEYLKLTELITIETKKALEKLDIKYVDQEKNAPTSRGYVYLEVLIDRLTTLIVSSKYNENEFELGYADEVILLTREAASRVYNCIDKEQCKKILLNFKEIGNTLNSNEDVRRALKNYHASVLAQDTSLDNLKRLCNIILRKTSLNLSRKYIIKKKCKFIQSKLTGLSWKF
jgi:hypothetical protein